MLIISPGLDRHDLPDELAPFLLLRREVALRTARLYATSSSPRDPGDELSKVDFLRRPPPTAFGFALTRDCAR